LYSTANTNVLYSKTDNNTVNVTNGGTPYSTMPDIFKGYDIHVFLTSDPIDPLHVSHTLINLSGNGSNTLLTSGGGFSAVGSSTHNYRFTYRLDSFDVGGRAQVDMSGADLILEECDIHSNNATTFDVPANSSITGGSFASNNCLNANVTTKGTTVNFTNYYLP